MSVPRLTFLYPTFLWAARGALCSTACRHAVRQVGHFGGANRRAFGPKSRPARISRPIALHRRCATTLQETPHRRDDSVLASAPTKKRSATEVSENQTNGSPETSATKSSEPNPTDIGRNYTPPEVQEKIDGNLALRESLKDTSALDVLTDVKESEQKSSGGKDGQNSGQNDDDGGDAAGQGSSVKQTTPSEPTMSPNVGRLYHNFDTYEMVKQLESSGFSYNQSVIAMKAIRNLLATNLDKAKDSMVSNSNSENESYLFRAACSELKTEIETSRRTTLEKTRIDSAQIQHNYDQLEQKLSEDLMNLKDEVSSLFNDRKITTRQEQRAMEVKIQELNYKLTVLLNGDMKSEIEALRWTTTRRGLIAIAIIAVVVVTLIRYTSVQSHATKKEASHEPKEVKQKDALHSTADSGLIASISSSPSSARDKPGGNGDGDSGSFVSLG